MRDEFIDVTSDEDTYDWGNPPRGKVIIRSDENFTIYRYNSDTGKLIKWVDSEEVPF